MKLTTFRFSVILTIQTALLGIDLGVNIISLLTRQSNAIMLMLFIIQDACLVLALSVLLLTFFSTYVFQTGLVYLLYERFRFTLIICMFYFVLTTIVHLWSLIMRWNHLKHNWNAIFLSFFVIQRLTSVLYYYYYKRASLRISDPRFYEEVEWEQNRLRQANIPGN
ncbi:transmembrane protein 138 [Cylas formicarius]|uniref:transmembrane protein 138 n=1 Tax=Cylas formicarius TaxID=197179 RepID=UPI0029584B9E|nr:transmembrane protein 138 [Cylas formicarius]